MQMLKTSWIALGVTSLLSAFQAEVAQARSLPASQGRAVDAADMPCFSMVPYAAIQNTCSTTKRFELQLPVDSTGSYNITLNVGGPMTCHAFAATQSGTLSGSVVTGTATAAGNLTFTVTIPSHGTISVGCEIPAGGRINSVYWV